MATVPGTLSRHRIREPRCLYKHTRDAAVSAPSGSRLLATTGRGALSHERESGARWKSAANTTP